MTPSCYNGKILHVDLTQRKIWVEEPPESFYRKYGGGGAMGLFYILKEMPRGVDALAPENILTLFLGVPTGLPISGQSRMTANARSPLTGAIGDSQCGGFFPAELKFAGFDGIVLRGRSPAPVYLWINDGQVEIRDAGHLWGKLTGETEDLIKQELGDTKVEVLQIGPAGENKVRFAAIMNMVNRANGRTGMGAVMGSKNLKAVVVRGTGKLNAANPRALTEMFRSGTKAISDMPSLEFLHIHGTAGDVAGQHASGGLPTYNFNEGQFDSFELISGELMTETILTDRDTCFSCSVRCKRVVETEFNKRHVWPRYGGIEYETMATLGSYCAVSDMDAIALANQLCNQYGLDTISCGATIAFAMECFKNGLISREDTGGIDLSFGNADAMVQMVEQIGRREGFGKVLAEGSQMAASIIGKNAADYLITSKGQEAPAHMPQAKRMVGLLYAINPFGADHMSAEHDPFYEKGSVDELALGRLASIGLTTPQEPGSINAEKVRFLAVTQQVYSSVDSFNLCSFVYGPSWQMYGPEDTVKMLNAATGWDLSLEEYLQVGERRINMMRAFNAREELDRENDELSKKFFKPLQGKGPTAGVCYNEEEFERMKDEYYRLVGWDIASGNPLPETLQSLGLDWIEM
jgi:aldehyde:ferredoxin oxidoreductase